MLRGRLAHVRITERRREIGSAAHTTRSIYRPLLRKKKKKMSTNLHRTPPVHNLHIHHPGCCQVSVCSWGPPWEPKGTPCRTPSCRRGCTVTTDLEPQTGRENYEKAALKRWGVWFAVWGCQKRGIPTSVSTLVIKIQRFHHGNEISNCHALFLDNFYIDSKKIISNKLHFVLEDCGVNVVTFHTFESKN